MPHQTSAISHNLHLASESKILPPNRPNASTSNNVSHNLNIQNYNFQELLGLFDLTPDMTLADLKRAKRKVLFLHPDKSRLAPQYFLFYKRAFEIIVSFYEERTKQEREIPQEPIKYTPTVDRAENPNARKMAEIVRKYQTSEGDGGGEAAGFQRTFNDLFEQNMAKRPDPSRNQWFQDSAPVFTHESVTSQENLGQVMQTVKSQVAALAKYRGVQSMQYSGGTSFYDDDAPADDTDYVSADMFSKLKYDDLRKVHKDQTVFAVSERDYDPSKRAHNLDRLSQERNTQDLTPLEKSRAESILADQQREYERRMFQRQHESRLRTIEYERKNQDVMASFLRLRDA